MNRFFFCSGEGKGEGVRGDREGGGVGFLLEIQVRGSSPTRGGGGERAGKAGRVSAGNMLSCIGFMSGEAISPTARNGYMIPCLENINV